MKTKVQATVFIFILLSTAAFGVASSNLASAQTFLNIVIETNGKIYPPTASISTIDNVTYIFTDNINGEIWVERDNITIDGNNFNLQGEGLMEDPGIYIVGRTNITVQNIKIWNCNQGIFVESSSNISITGNKIANNTLGVLMADSVNNNIWDNDISANTVDGIRLHFSDNTLISNNNLSTNGDAGIWVSSSGNTISGNDITGNYYGVLLSYNGIPIANNIIFNNNITSNDEGVRLSSKREPNVIFNNTVNNNIISNGLCVTLKFSCNNTFSGNTLYSKLGAWGFALTSSSNNTLLGNTIMNTSQGVALVSSEYNSICGNNILSREFGGTGLVFTDSSGNIVIGNNLENRISITFTSSSKNTFYHNNFYSTSQIYDFSWDSTTNVLPSTNIWDNEYPFGGNYWSDYQEKYPDAFEIEGAGLWNTPYVIDTSDQDRYPLMLPNAISQLPAPIPTPSPSASPSLSPSPIPSSSLSSNPTPTQRSPLEVGVTPTPTPSVPEFSLLSLILLPLIGGSVIVIAYKRKSIKNRGAQI